MNAPELLAKLRAAGVEPMDDEELDRAARLALAIASAGAISTRVDRAAVTALAALGKLAEVRAWADRVAAEESQPRGIVAAERGGCASEVLEILGREPEP